MTIGILGSLEVRVDGEPVQLGGAKQRAVLAALLLRAGQVVAVDRLVDEVWGDDPPPSAQHTLEAYVSRLRQLVSGDGASLVRRGAGYCFQLGDAWLDAERFEELAESVQQAASDGALERCSELAAQAVALWRGPAFADVPLGPAGRAERERLEELRLRVLEDALEAQLSLGRHGEVVGELQLLVGQNPYRERFVAQLMLALYRSGRHAEALDVYERTRAALMDDLGLKPSAELQQLSGQIVRQEPQLREPRIELRVQTPVVALRARARRMSELVLVGAAVAATMALTASGSAPRPPAEPPSRAIQPPSEWTSIPVAFVLPKQNRDYTLNVGASHLFTASASAWDYDGRIIRVDETDAPATRRLVERITREQIGLVVAVGGSPVSQALAQHVRRLRHTRFAFLDASLGELGLEDVPNATAIRFAEEHTSQLMGYLSTLVTPRRPAAGRQVDRVSVVAGPRSADSARLVEGLRVGVALAGRGVAVDVVHVYDEADPTACERAANDHIDAGADVVFAAAGRCGLGALAVARIRGVWGIGSENDGVLPAPHVLAITYKEWERTVNDVISDFAFGTLPRGEERVLGLDDDYAVGIENTHPVVSEALWSKVVERCSVIRQAADANES